MQVSELIYRAYVKSNVISNEGETLTSAQNAEALFELNRLIEILNLDGAEISLITTEQFTLTEGTTFINLTDYLQLKKVEYFLGNVKLDLALLPMEEFYRAAVLPSVTSIPICLYSQRNETGIVLNLYFTPGNDYVIEVHGLKRITQDLAIGDTISGLDQFYIPLLYFELAAALRDNNDLPDSPSVNRKIAQIKDRLRHIKTYDVMLNTVQCTPILSPQQQARQNVSDATIHKGGLTP